MIWIISIAALILILWLVLSFVVGKAMPSMQSGNYYLRSGLKKHGINADTLSRECLDELVATAIETATTSIITSGEGFNTEFNRELDTIVDVVILQSSTSSNAQAISMQMPATKKYAEILAKYRT